MNRERTGKPIICCVVAALLFLFSACAKEEPVKTEDGAMEASRQFFAMDTAMDITVYGPEAEEALESAVEKVESLDAMLSAESSNSELHELNETGLAITSEDTRELILRGQDLYEDTDGAFNICIYPVKKAWGFPDKNYRIPAEEELKKLLALADPGAIEFVEKPGFEWGIRSDNQGAEAGGPATAIFQGVEYGMKGMEIDLGGIAKGHASDQVIERVLRREITGAKVSLGGNVAVVGEKPDGSPWRIGIQDPDGNRDYLGILEIAPEEVPTDAALNPWDEGRGMAVVTSGNYERYFEKDGKRYHHILDPSTGYPAESGLVSVTVISQSGATADALSTALFVMGKERAEDYWRNYGGSFDMILLDEMGTVYFTQGIAEKFTTEYPAEMIEW